MRSFSRRAPGKLVDAFAAFYKLQDLRRASDHIFGKIDALALPTMPTVYTVRTGKCRSDPTQQPAPGPHQLRQPARSLRSCCTGIDASDGAPFGVTLLAPAGNDAFLAAIGRVFHADTALPLGAIGEAQPPLAALAAAPNGDEIAIAVVGAHLSGMPLNAELRALGARLLERTMTAADYRLYALAESDPPRPGLVRIAPGRGKAIEVEVWALPAEGFGRFVATVAPPLSIGTLRLAGGRTVKGFLCEAEAVKSAQDISRCGGWRAYLAETAVLGASVARQKAPKRAVVKGKARKKTTATKKIAKRSARRAQ